MIFRMSSLGVARPHRPEAARLAAMSRAALDRPLQHDGELLLAEPADSAVVLGALQRVSEIESLVAPADRVIRRGSCGAEARVGPGTLWMQLALVRPSALAACPPDRLLNRYVRPLLRGLTKVGALAHYFDRDWISVAKRPVGLIGFAHDAGTGRVLIEALVAIAEPFALRTRPSYLGKEPATLAEIGASADVARVADAVAEAYAAAYSRSMVAIDDPASDDGAEDPRLDPPWAKTHDEAIGIVAAGRDRHGKLRVGGELMASRDAVARLEQRVDGGAEPAEIDRAIDESLHAAGVALLGVRSLLSLKDVIVAALQ